MHSLEFTAEPSSNDMVERDFTVGDVPGLLSPASGADRASLADSFRFRKEHLIRIGMGT
jgi:hypothetical protein